MSELKIKKHSRKAQHILASWMPANMTAHVWPFGRQLTNMWENVSHAKLAQLHARSEK
jgi:hypothetical protein